MQPEVLEESGHVGDHFFQAVVGFARVFDANNFHLVKLVQAVEATHVLAIGTCLAAEAGAIGGHFDGQIGFWDNLVAEQIGHGDLGRGDGIEVILRHMVHLAFFVRQLARTKSGGLIDEMRGLYFKVARRGIPVQKELDQRALQASALACIHREARARNFHAAFKIDEFVAIRQLPVGHKALLKDGRMSPGSHHFIIVGGFARGYGVMGRIGQGDEVGALFRLHLLEGCREEVQALLDVGTLCQFLLY